MQRQRKAQNNAVAEDHRQPQRLISRTGWQEPHQHRQRRQYQVGVVIEFDGIHAAGQRADDHRTDDGREGDHGEKQRRVSCAALQHIGNEVHVPAAANIKDVNQQERHYQHQ